jgi:hypothetical protein
VTFGQVPFDKMFFDQIMSFEQTACDYVEFRQMTFDQQTFHLLTLNQIAFGF